MGSAQIPAELPTLLTVTHSAFQLSDPSSGSPPLYFLRVVDELLAHSVQLGLTSVPGQSFHGIPRHSQTEEAEKANLLAHRMLHTPSDPVPSDSITHLSTQYSTSQYSTV